LFLEIGFEHLKNTCESINCVNKNGENIAYKYCINERIRIRHFFLEFDDKKYVDSGTELFFIFILAFVKFLLSK
jgi:hypothetical protein